LKWPMETSDEVVRDGRLTWQVVCQVKLVIEMGHCGPQATILSCPPRRPAELNAQA
jgi:hypothetical protein